MHLGACRIKKGSRKEQLVSGCPGGVRHTTKKEVREAAVMSNTEGRQDIWGPLSSKSCVEVPRRIWGCPA